MSTMIGDAGYSGGILRTDDPLRSPVYNDPEDRYNMSPTFQEVEEWYRPRWQDGVSGHLLLGQNSGVRFEGTELASGTHSTVAVSDQMDVDLCEAATNWAQIGTWTTAPATVDDNRIEGNFCLQGRNSQVNGWTGVIMPPAAQVWQYDADRGDGRPNYLDQTTAFNNATATDCTPFPATEAAGDMFLIGWQAPIGGAVITIATNGVGGSVTWKYWDGTTWQNLSGVVDNTTGFTAGVGTFTVTWNMPTNWARQALGQNPNKLYYVAAVVSVTYGTNPVLTQGLLLYNSGLGNTSIYFWINLATPAAADTFARGGLRVSASSDLTPTLAAGTWPNNGPTNSRQWWVNGSDGLRVSGFIPYVFDPTVVGNLDIGAPNLTQVRRVGLGIGMLSAIGATTTNIFWDAVRIGSGMILRYGGPNGNGIDFADLLTLDYDMGSMWGFLQNSNGIYYYCGKLYVGEVSQVEATYFEDINQTLVFRNVPVVTTFHEIRVIGNSSVTSSFVLGTYVNSLAANGCSIRGAARTNVADPSPATSVWSYTGKDAYAVTKLYGSTFTEMYRMSLNSVSEVRGCTFQNFGDITANGALFDGCSFRDLYKSSPILATYGVKVQTVVSALTNCTFVNCATAVIWDVNADTTAPLSGTKFTSGGTGNAIELGTNVPTTLGLSGVTFVGYGANTTADAAIYNNSGKTVTINVSGGGSTPTYINGVGATTIVNNNVTLTVTVTNAAGLAVPGMRVRVEKQSDHSMIAEGVTNSSGIFTASVNYTVDTPVYVIARLKGYVNNKGSATITTSGMSVPFTALRDSSVNLP